VDDDVASIIRPALADGETGDKKSGGIHIPVGRCRLTASKPALKARLASALETGMR